MGRFEKSETGDVSRMPILNVTRDRVKGAIAITDYTEDVVQRYGIEG